MSQFFNREASFFCVSFPFSFVPPRRIETMSPKDVSGNYRAFQEMMSNPDGYRRGDFARFRSGQRWQDDAARNERASRAATPAPRYSIPARPTPFRVAQGTQHRRRFLWTTRRPSVTRRPTQHLRTRAPQRRPANPQRRSVPVRTTPQVRGVYSSLGGVVFEDQRA